MNSLPAADSATALLPGIDVYNPDNYTDSVPFEMFRQLRQHAPVYRHPHPDGGYFWAVTRHRDVMQVSRDYKTYSAERGFVMIDDLAPDLLHEAQNQLLAMDPPNHAPIRKTVISRFTTRRVDNMEPRIRAMVGEILDEAAERRECDFIFDVTALLPTRVICEMMGIPREHWQQIREWADQQTSADDPDIVSGPDAAREASVAMGTLGYQLACERQQQARLDDDLMMELLQSEIDGKPVDAMQFASLFIQITVAGNETTRNLMANGMLELMARPEVYRQLENEPERLPLAIEEMLRITCPLHHFRRTATCDTELGGQRIREGDRVVMWYVSANRDEEVFADPDRLDIDRKPNPHLSFGHGIHLCLGAHLARLETRVFFEEFFRRFTGLELTGPTRRIRSNLNNGLKAMPVRLLPR